MTYHINKAKFVRHAEQPQFCIIAPTAYLNHYATQSRTHLVLAHLVDVDDAYAAFYKARSDAGDRLIMDNGAFELGESYEPNKLVALGHKCGAHAIVLPDYPFQPAAKTVEAAEKLIPQVVGAGFATFFVPQSQTGQLDDWATAYQWAARNPDIDIIGMSILGVPNAIPHIPTQYARVVMTQLLIDRGILADKHHHYLGLNSGPNVEIPALLKMGALDTCDSSNPVWCGLNGIRYNETLSDWMGVQKKYLREVDFNEHFAHPAKKAHIHEAVQHNINLTLGLFNNV